MKTTIIFVFYLVSWIFFVLYLEENNTKGIAISGIALITFLSILLKEKYENKSNSN